MNGQSENRPNSDRRHSSFQGFIAAAANPRTESRKQQSSHSTMASYIVKSSDIGRTLTRIEELVTKSAGTVLTNKRDFVPVLGTETYRRIQNFYYCDDFEGITVRLFDRQFISE